MADSPSTKSTPASKRPTLLPQAEHAGKPAMPLGAHLFTLIGARNRAHLHLLSSTISRNHACIITGKSGVYVRDLASRNGVIVNDRKVRESELHDGDLMQVGSFKFKFQEPPGPIRLGTTPRPPLAMLEMDGRALTPMEERTVLIGRRPGCDITLDSPAVSNTHAVIFECDGKRYVRDLGSRTGTQVNGNTVHQQAIEIGDQIKIGSTTLRYIAADMPAIAADESLPLDLEPAASDAEAVASLDLHFDEPPALQVEEPVPAAPSELEPIPLIEPAAERAETIAPVAKAAAAEIEFPAAHAHELPAELPLEDQIPLPVEEEIPAVQREVTAAAPAIPEPADDLSLDVWTPPSEQTVTADAAAVEPATAYDEPIALEPEQPAIDQLPETLPEQPETEQLALAPADQAIGPVEEHAAIKPIPFEQPTAVEAETSFVETREFSPVESVRSDVEATESPAEEHPIGTESIAPPPSPSIALIDESPTEAAPEPVLGELAPVPVEPEASPLENTAAVGTPDVAEPLNALEPDAEEALVEAPVSPVEEHQFAIDEQASLIAEHPAPISEEAAHVEEHSVSFDAVAGVEHSAPATQNDREIASEVGEQSEITATSDAQGESSELQATEEIAESAAPEQMDEPALHPAAVPVEEAFSVADATTTETPTHSEAAEPAQGVAVCAVEEPAATVDAARPTVETPAEIDATTAEPSGAQEVTSSTVGQIDLSNVTFGAEIAEAESTIDTSPEPATAPVPLLDLVSPTSETPAEPETAIPPTEAIEPAVSTDKKRAARSPRKKQGISRGRRKKSEVVAEASPSAGEVELTAPIADAAPNEPSATDTTPTASEPGFVTSDETDASASSIAAESSAPEQSSEAAVVEAATIDPHHEPVSEASADPMEPAAAEPVAGEAMPNAGEAVAEPLASETFPEALSDFETAAVHETPPESEFSSALPEPQVPAEAGAEATAAPSAIESIVNADVATLSPAEAFSASEEVTPHFESLEAVSQASIPQTDAPVASAEFPLRAEEASSESQIDTAATPGSDADFPLVDAELPPLPPLPDEDPALTERSELTTHIDFVSVDQVAVVSVTEPVETIEGTEPTPESALDLEPSLPAFGSEAIETELQIHPDALLSDTAFGEVVTDFAGRESGPLVEETPLARQVESNVELPADESTFLTSLGDADVAPLELGEALTFGSDEETATPAAEDQVQVVAEPLEFQTPAVTDSTSSQAGFELTAPVALESLEPDLESIESPLDTVEPELNLESVPEIFSELTRPVEEEPRFDAGLEWEEPPFGELPKADESGLEFEPLPISGPISSEPAAPENISLSSAPQPIASEVSFTSTETDAAPAAPSAKASSQPRAEATPPTQPRRPMPPVHPFFGMERDLGSFIGGMPLALGAAPPVAQPTKLAQPGFTAPAASVPLVPPANQPISATPTPSGTAAEEPRKFNEQTKDELDLDRLFEGDEPLELFDETAEQLDKLPDSLEPIGDLGSAIGEPLSPASAAAPAVAPKISTAPAAPLRSLTADTASVPSNPPTASITVPPFAGAARSGKGANPFAEALGGLRPTDVFSQTAFPPMAEPTFKAQPLDIPPMSTGPSIGARLAPPPGSGSGAPPLKTDGDAIAAAPPPRPMAPRPTAAMLADQRDERRPWWKNIRVLLPLLVLLILAAAVVIIRFVSPKTVVHGTLQIKGIDDRALDVYARREQINRIRKDLVSPELREAATQRLVNQGIQPGFVRSEQAMASIADPSNSPFEDGRLVLSWSQEDWEDGARMRAVLQAMYLINKTAAEQTAQIRGQAAAAAEKSKAAGTRADAQHEELQKLAGQVKAAAGAAATDMLLDPNAAVDTLQLQDGNLRRALDQANAEVADKHNQWQQAQDAAHQGVRNDPRVLQIRQSLASLNSRLTVARVSGEAQVDPAKKFDDALTTVDADLAFLGQANPNDQAFANYVSTARQAMAQIHSLLGTANQDASRIDDLRQQLAAHREAHLRQVFAADETLKGLLEEREAQAHRFGTASDSGYSQDAARIQGILDELDQKIEARRQLLATTGLSSDDLQQHLEQTIEQLRDDQNDRRTKIAAALERLDVPAAGKLPLSDEGRLTRIGQDVVDAKTTYDQYASGTKTTGVDSAAEVQKLQAEIAEQQAQLDAYEQRADTNGPVAAARQALDAAQDAQAKAQAAYAANLNDLTLTRRYHDEQIQYNDTTSAHDAADRDAQAKAAEAGATPILLPPDPRNAVQLVSGPDQRVWYLAGAIGLILLLFAAPIWMAVREPRVDLPYAAVVAARDRHGDDVYQEDLPLMDDDEHPALT